MMGPVVEMGGAGGAGGLTFIAEHTTPVGGESSFSFTAIPGTHRELLLIWQARGDNAALQNLFAQFNADTGNNYYQNIAGLTNVTFTGYPSVAQSSIGLGTATGTGAPAGSAAAGQAFFPKYSKTVFHKQIVGQDYRSDSALVGGQTLYSRGGRWANTSAITAIKLFLSAGNFVAGSTFALYGVG